MLWSRRFPNRPANVSPNLEFTAGGTTLTGAITAPTVRRCGLALENVGGHWRCNSKRTATTFNALRTATVQLAAQARTTLRTSFDGTTPDPTGVDVDYIFGGWSTTEPSLP